MLPKFLTHFSTTTAAVTLTTRRSYCTFPLVLLGLLLVLHPVISNAERDFNFNDSQVPLIEPKDEPTLIDQSSSSSTHHLQQLQHQDPYAVELSHCRYGDNELVLSLVLKNYNWHDLSDSRKAKVLEKLSKFFAIPKEFITMESVTKHELFEMQKESLKKGNNKCHNNNRKLGRVNFIIGCGSTYFTMSEPISKQIGQQVKDGALDNITGEKFGWWVIWRKQIKTRAPRNRRQIEGSGEDDEDDDYDYDYGEDGDNEETPEEPAKDISTTTTHAHRHHHGDTTSEITSNMLEVTNTENDISNNNVQDNNDVNDNDNDDITALKQTDNNVNEDSSKKDSNLLLLNKKGTIDEEIVESVSQLESVITKTIENTKNLDDLPEIVVDQTDDELLTEVLQPLTPVEDTDSTKNSENINLNTIYENPNEDNPSNTHSNSHNDFQLAEVIDSLTPSTTTPTLMISNSPNSPPAGVNLQENIDNNSATSTTPLSFNLNHNNKDNHLDVSSSLSSHETTKYHSLSPPPPPPPALQNSDHHSSSTLLIEATTITSHFTPPTPAILTDSTSSTTTTTNTPNDISSITSSATTSYSSSSSTSTLSSSSNILNKDMTTLEPEDNQESNTKSSSTTPQPSEDANSPAPNTTANTQATTTLSTTQEIPSSTPALPDYIEPKIENSPPLIKSRLQKMAVTSGKSFRLSVPEDTFYDNEDLSNLRLELTDKEGRELKTNSWLQFNAETKEIYGLPLDDAVSKWQYRLTATDSGNESVTETLEIAVQQHRGVRTVNHEINIAVKINEKNMHYIDWQMNLINAIASTLGDVNTNLIVVREIRSNPQDPNTATLVYFNETLPTSECPENELNTLIKRLDANRLSDLVQPSLGIKSITGQLIGSCQKTITAKPKPTLNIKNSPPVPRNQVDRVVATVGHLLVYKVPADTFFDDGELTLSLKTKEHKELSPRHWLQFDSKNEEFYGIPKSGDTGSEEYMLVAEDAGGLTATDALVVQVNHAPKKEFSVYFKAYLAIRHEQFNADLQRKFVERIARLFGDASTQNIQIRSVTTNHDLDGTIVNFYNNTLFKSHNRCPEEEMEVVRSVYLHDYSLRESVKKALGPELNITNVQVVPFPSCNAQTDVTHREFVPNKPEEPLLKSTFSDDYMFTIILPAIIIVSMIFCASIIACCLHRRRRKSGKMELGDEEERKSFRTKGIPVIFQDELDEKPEIGNKSPIILKDEKPPLLPPSYNTSNMNGDNDVDEYVPPPAVVVGGREARGKSPATPSYRKPPPYVSP